MKQVQAQQFCRKRQGSFDLQATDAKVAHVDANEATQKQWQQVLIHQ